MRGFQSLTTGTLGLIIGTVLLLGLGQVLFKMAAPTFHSGDPRSYFSPVLLGALALYGVATLAWLAVLARVPLSTAFPFYGLGFFVVPLLSAALLKEPLRLSTFVGGALIVAGIIVTTRDW